MNSAVEKFVKWVREYDSTLEFNLNAPADIESIENCQNIIGEQFPELLRELYLQFNGQAWANENGIFYGFEFVPLEVVIEGLETGTVPSKEELVMDGYWNNDVVKPYCYYPKWIPFAHDGGGNYLSLDFDPGENGKNGQVIANGDLHSPFFITNDFDNFLIWYANRLESGKYFIGAPSGTYDEPVTEFMYEKDTSFSQVLSDLKIGI